MEEKTINTAELKSVEELKENLYNAINESGLSIVPVYYVMKDLMNEIILIYNSELKKLEEEKKKDESAEKVEE